MSSLTRRMQRRFQRAKADYESPPQPVDVHETYYRALHPTKGWRVVSNKRVWAQHRMAQILGS